MFDTSLLRSKKYFKGLEQHQANNQNCSSADGLCKHLDPDQTRQNTLPDLDPNCLTLSPTHPNPTVKENNMKKLTFAFYMFCHIILF